MGDASPRLDFAPVLRRIPGDSMLAKARWCWPGKDPYQFAPRLHQWRREGLTPFHADRWAVKVGCHPAELWPEWPARCREWAAFDNIRKSLGVAS